MRTHQGVKSVEGFPRTVGDDDYTTSVVQSDEPDKFGATFKSGRIIPIQGPNGHFAAVALELHDGNQVILPVHNLEHVVLCETTEEQNLLAELRERREQVLNAAIHLSEEGGADTLAIMELKSAVEKYKEVI